MQVARHKDRPYTSDYLDLVFDEFVELHGDRRFGDDRAIRHRLRQLDQHKVMVVGHQKGSTYKERSACYFGCAHPEGYRKAMLKMKLAAKYGLPVICLIDTPGAYPGIGAEERGQSQAIAENMFEMSRLPHARSFASSSAKGAAAAPWASASATAWRCSSTPTTRSSAPKAAPASSGRATSTPRRPPRPSSSRRRIARLGVVDHVIEEPLGGAHRDHQQTAMRVKQFLLRSLRELLGQSLPDLLAARYDKFRKIGVFLEEVAEPNPD